MITIPEINRHWIGIPALALAVIGLGIMGNAAFKRTTESLPQVGSAEMNQAASAADIISQLKQIPKNAFGSAQPLAPSQYSLSGDQPSNSTSESKNWTKEEWRLANAAVTAYRKGGRKALNATASSNLIWQPPEEIANSNNNTRETR